MSLLHKLEKSLTEKVENQVDEAEKDMEFAAEMLEENPEVQSTANSMISDSLPVLLLKAGLVNGIVYTAWTFLSLGQLAVLSYLLIGFSTAMLSDYSFSDWEYSITVALWLPAVLYGLLPDEVRLDK